MRHSSLLAAVLAFGSVALAQPAGWNDAFPPHKIMDNVYYVGTKELATFLITTPQGHILMNSNYEASVPVIRTGVEQLGFKFSDIKILLISHGHWDHGAGSALVKQLTGATYMVMAPDVPVVESGGRADFYYGSFPAALYPPTKVDRVLHDGDEVKLGDTVLVAHLTAGHTKGCTTWTMKVTEAGRDYNAVIIGSPNVNEGFDLVANKRYPQIADDYARGFGVLKSLPCDLFLGAHGKYFGMLEKRAQPKPGGANPFVDPVGYAKFVAEREKIFRDELAKQKAAAAHP
jgi:metallo-beta-lactamase class B